MAYDQAHERTIRFMLDLAVAANGTADNLVRELSAEFDRVQSEVAAASTPLPPGPPT